MIKSFIRYGKHKRNCRAVYHVRRKFWDSAWVCPEMYMNYNRSSSSGLIFRCNDPDCNARIKIPLKVLEIRIPKF